MKPHAALLAPCLAAALALCACAKDEQAPTPRKVPPPLAPSDLPIPLPATSGQTASQLHPDLLDPSKASATAPDVFEAKFTTTKGEFVVEVHRDWAPNGADRFYNLVKMGFYDGTRFFRAVDGFMVQWGISGDPLVSQKWVHAPITDDPVKQSNKRGFVTFAKQMNPNSRTTQVFVNYVDNSRLDASGFAPFGQVTKGMEVLDSLYKGYGEGAPQGAGPNQSIVVGRGDAYLDQFPKLDAIQRAEIVVTKK